MKKARPKQTSKLSSEQRPSDLKAHKELAHEDTDAIYPYQPVKPVDKNKKKR